MHALSTFSVPVKTVVHEAISRDRSRKNLELMVSKQQLAVGEPHPHKLITALLSHQLCPAHLGKLPACWKQLSTVRGSSEHLETRDPES